MALPLAKMKVSSLADLTERHWAATRVASSEILRAERTGLLKAPPTVARLARRSAVRTASTRAGPTAEMMVSEWEQQWERRLVAPTESHLAVKRVAQLAGHWAVRTAERMAHSWAAQRAECSEQTRVAPRARSWAEHWAVSKGDL